MFNISFNAGRSRQAIREAMAELEDMTPVFEEIGEYLVRKRVERFTKGVDPDGNPWARKSAATLERYKRLGYGVLSRPLIGPSRSLSRQIQKFVSKGGVVIGSSLIYSNVMQEGAAKGAFGTDRHGRPIPWGRIPARRWIDLDREEDDAIVDIVEENLAGKLDAQG